MTILCMHWYNFICNNFDASAVRNDKIFSAMDQKSGMKMNEFSEIP